MKVKMHSGCIGQANVALRRAEPPAPFCRCKKRIDYKEADLMVKQGAAKWVVIGRTRGAAEVDCTFCASMTDSEKRSCAKCKGTGKIVENKVWEDFNKDIVLLGDDREGFKAKTPRVATVEKKHIIRAFVDKLEYAVARIEEYARMIQEALALFGPKNRCKLGASLIDARTGETIVEGNPEPENNFELAQGREWDRGIPALRIIGDLKEINEISDDQILDRPPYPPPSNSEAATDINSERNKVLLRYSLDKIDEGDFQDCGEYVVAAGISWKKSELREGVTL